MDIIVIHKSAFATGEFRGVKKIEYNSATYTYTITKSDDTTVQYNSASYYIQFIWG